MGKSEETRISVVMVEDDLDLSQTVQEFIRRCPDLCVLGAARGEKEFQKLVAAHLPELALIDIGLDTPRSGLNLLDWLKREFPVVKPIIMTVNQDDVLEAYNKGARGYVLKSELQILAPTLLDVHQGKLVIPPKVGELFVQQVADQSALWKKSLELEHFSEREREILRLLKARVPREKIADNLNISFFTVRRHIQNILEKSGQDSVKDLLEKFGRLLDAA